MQCDICKKNEAVVHYAEVINGEIRKLNICEQCAKDKGFGLEVSFSLGDMLAGIIKDSSRDSEKIIPSLEKCEKCGMSYEEFKKTGRLGCDNCYRIFEKKLIPILDTIHKQTRHKGKVPKAYRERFDKIEKIRELNRKLKEAVENEEFEQAAVLRDKIKEMSRKENVEETL
ncbi:MAG: UvrB/UvrC motif-containing protein [Candidatus Aureabacteria bacterium]|nr:UvrB/UvrC motif-containing protein [Candidatus Auribacterota bacterium]